MYSPNNGKRQDIILLFSQFLKELIRGSTVNGATAQMPLPNYSYFGSICTFSGIVDFNHTCEKNLRGSE